MSKNKFSRRALLKAGSATAIGVTAPWIMSSARAQAAHTMTFGHTFGAATADVMITGLDLFKQKAEEYSGGQLLVDIHEAGSLGGQTVLPQKVLTNAIQGCQLSTQNFTPYSDAFNMLDMPYLFPTNQGFEKILTTDEFKSSTLVSQPRDKGFEVLPGMWANAGFRVLGVSKKADRVIKSPDDLDGIKIRVTGSKVEQQVFKLTPANPVSIAWGETYQAMQQGAADALNVGLGPLTATKIFETLGSATMSEINFNCHVTVLSQKWFSNLPEDVQEAIYRAAAESFDYQQEAQAEANKNMVEQWKAQGIQVHVLSADEKKVWADTMGHTLPVWDSFKDRYGRELYDKLVSMV